MNPLPKKRKMDRAKLDGADQALHGPKKRTVREHAVIIQVLKSLGLKAGTFEVKLDAEQEGLESSLRLPGRRTRTRQAPK